MDQFTVPQFIDVEDRIIGVITVRQFIICIVAGLVLFLEYKLSDLVLFIFLAIPTAIIFGCIAFLRINGMPFHYFLINFIETNKLPSLRIWQRLEKLENVKIEKESVSTSIAIKKPLSTDHLADLSLIVDTGGYYRGHDIEDKDVSFDIKKK